MSAFLFIVVPVVTFVVILLACKWGNFSLIPKGMKLPTPSKYKLPKVSRNSQWQWEIESESEESNSSDEESDAEESDEEVPMVYF
jgi:hypothetical protein